MRKKGGMIRLATPADAAEIAAIYAPYVTDNAVSFETEPPDATEMAARIGRVLPQWPWLVAVGADGTIAGYVYAGRHRERAAYRWGVDVAVYIAPDAKRMGVGRRLYMVLFELLRRQGYARAYALITLPNPGSVALHEAMGFTPVGVHAKTGYKLGAWHDVGWWDLDLGLPDGPPAEPVALTALDLPPNWP